MVTCPTFTFLLQQKHRVLDDWIITMDAFICEHHSLMLQLVKVELIITTLHCARYIALFICSESQRATSLKHRIYKTSVSKSLPEWKAL